MSDSNQFGLVDHVLIRQIYYDQKQLPHLDPSCEPFFNDKAPPREFEFGVMKWITANLKLFPDDKIEYTGFFSWKFEDKARMSAAKFLKFVSENPGADIYLVNPFPEQVVHANNWFQADTRHPGLLNLSKNIFETAGLSWDPAETPNIPYKLAYCNFWVANRKVWDLFLHYSLKFYEIIQNDPKINQMTYSVAPGATSAGATYFTFFYERIMTEILVRHPEIKVCSYRYPAKDLQKVFEPRFAEFLSQLPSDQNISDFLHYSRWQELADYRFKLIYQENELSAPILNREFYRILLGVGRRLPWMKPIIQNRLTYWVRQKMAIQERKKLLSGCKSAATTN